MSMDNGVMSMRRVKAGLEIKPGRRGVQSGVAPSHADGLKQPLAKGERGEGDARICQGRKDRSRIRGGSRSERSARAASRLPAWITARWPPCTDSVRIGGRLSREN